jgi:hypothetical protein
VATGIASPIIRRRPRTSASRPPTMRPSPAGVAVMSVNIAIVLASKSRTSRR